MVEKYYMRLFIDSQSPKCFQLDLYYIMVELDYESIHKSKLDLTWEVILEKDVFVDDAKSICEIFVMTENYDLHTLFG